MFPGGTLQGIALGLGAMYLFDPVQGKRRQSVLRRLCFGRKT
jgi:hypothetical protein